MNEYITVDPVKKILIRPGFEAIPVVKDKKCGTMMKKLVVNAGWQ